MPEPIRSLKRWIHFFNIYLPYIILYIVFVSHKFVEAMPKGVGGELVISWLSPSNGSCWCVNIWTNRNNFWILLLVAFILHSIIFNYIQFLRIFFVLFMEDVFARRSTALSPSREWSSPYQRVSCIIAVSKASVWSSSSTFGLLILCWRRPEAVKIHLRNYLAGSLSLCHSFSRHWARLRWKLEETKWKQQSRAKSQRQWLLVLGGCTSSEPDVTQNSALTHVTK